jgi:hypothetical protein
MLDNHTPQKEEPCSWLSMVSKLCSVCQNFACSIRSHVQRSWIYISNDATPYNTG